VGALLVIEHATPELALDRDPSGTVRDQFDNGVRNFSLLFTRWMDTNGWSHPVMVNLATSCLELPDNKGWLHSSQISGLRHGTLLSPGPRTFVAIARLNYYVHRYATTKKLLPGTSSSSFYSNAYAITEDGSPPSLGWWVEVFCGARVPKDIDIATRFFTEGQAGDMSVAWGKLVRRLLMAQGLDLIDDLDRVVREHYPVREVERVERLLAVIHGRVRWTADQLLMELPAINALTAGIGGPEDEEELLALINS